MNTIRFFEVFTDPDSYQFFLFEDSSQVSDLYFDGTPRTASWSPPAVFSSEPRLHDGDFWDYGLMNVGAAFAVSPRALVRRSSSRAASRV